MRRYPASSEPAPAATGPRNDWQTIRSLLPYLSAYKWRVAFALACLIGAKVANLGVPVVMKRIVDSLAAVQHLTALGRAEQSATVVLAGGVGLLVIAYALARLSTSLFTELREILFSKVTESAVRRLALQVFRHLHGLSLRFHLERQTGGMSRDIERGTRGIQQLISYSLYSILPTLVEVGLVLGFFVVKYEAYYAYVTFAALITYIVFTVKVTNWRTHLRRTMNELDSRANSRAIDSLINYETVKYFGNEEWEAQRYDENLKRYRKAAIRSQNSLSFLNFGQQAIIGTGLVFILWRATQGVLAGRLTLGDLVLINTFMLQLYIPLNFLGVVYRELKQSLTDMDRMFGLLSAAREVDAGEPYLGVWIGESGVHGWLVSADAVAAQIRYPAPEHADLADALRELARAGAPRCAFVAGDPEWLGGARISLADVGDLLGCIVLPFECAAGGPLGAVDDGLAHSPGFGVAVGLALRGVFE